MRPSDRTVKLAEAPRILSSSGELLRYIGGFRFTLWLSLVLAGTPLVLSLYVIFASAMRRIESEAAAVWVPVCSMVLLVSLGMIQLWALCFRMSALLGQLQRSLQQLFLEIRQVEAAVEEEPSAGAGRGGAERTPDRGA